MGAADDFADIPSRHMVWSHVGTIYRGPTLHRAFIRESEPLIGARLAPLSKYLSDYLGKNQATR